MLKPIFVPFGDWRPDIAQVNSGFCTVAKNVFPHPNGYCRMPTFEAGSANAVAAAVRGAAFFDPSTGANLWAFAGTSQALYRLTSLSGTWEDVTRASGGAYGTGTEYLWNFCQSGNVIIAVNPNDDTQAYTAGSSTDFAALSGSPPRALGASQVGDFLVLWGVSNGAGRQNKVRWSAINDITGWTLGTNLSDEQEFPDLGDVTGVYGDKTGFVLQELGVRSFQFLPGDTSTIFQFQKIVGAKGCISPYGWATAPDGNIYYVSIGGFHVIGPGGFRDLGDHKVNEWFGQECNGNETLIQCTADPRYPRIVWAFRFSTPNNTRLVIYDYLLDRFSYAEISTQSLLRYMNGSPRKFDFSDSSNDAAGKSTLGAINTDKCIALWRGTGDLTATLTLAEMEPFLELGRNAYVRAVYPVVHVSELDMMDISDAYRMTLEGSQTTATTTTAETNGKFSFNADARLHQFSTAIAYSGASTWTVAKGLRIHADPSGEA